MQKRLIVEPIAEQLRIQFGNSHALELLKPGAATATSTQPNYG